MAKRQRYCSNHNVKVPCRLYSCRQTETVIIKRETGFFCFVGLHIVQKWQVHIFTYKNLIVSKNWLQLVTFEAEKPRLA